MESKKLFVKKIFSLCLIFVWGFAFAQNSVFTSPEALAESSTGSRAADAGFAEQEFRRGVQAYYRGAYNDAVMEFEKALSYLPSENIILEWLGKAYYKAGLEGVALAQWNIASDNGYGGLLLKNKIEIVRERRINDNNYDSPIKYTESGSYPGRNGERLIFSQPVSILPNPDGSVWVVAYGSNELLRMDVNGFVYQRSNGPLTGFDRPMDIIRLKDGNILICEFAGDRLSVFSEKGKYLKSFGSKGIGLGQVIGPQYTAQDENGNIYVTDFGNCRVNVFDSEGKALFNFGQKLEGFGGLTAPTGIAVKGDKVFVADAVKGSIYIFDTAGNYMGLLCLDKTFIHPEAMRLWGNYLIVCDKNKIYSVDCESGSVFENVNTGNAPSRVTCAVPDVNGNLLATDYTSNEIYVMAKLSELVGGLFVQIERVYAENFPKVTLEVKVENRHRQSVVGLKENNFVVTENKAGVLDYKMVGASSANKTADITLVIDRSMESAQYEEAIETAVHEIARAMDSKGTLRIVTCGQVPVQEYEGAPSGAYKFSLKAVKNPLSPACSVDLAVRLASNSLVNGEKKRAIVLIGTGTVSPASFEKYGLTDLTAYLNNNSIILSSVHVCQQAPSKEIDYLCRNTDGKEYYVYMSQGISHVVKDIIDTPSGIYVLSYQSSLPTSFGLKYLPVEVEVYLMNRSGRDDSGYFAPLQ
ncbi:MAG: hypothetical protein IJJ70_07485 [Treponema sp.]|nr:hypothetical protein [Treponema sp.]